MIPSSFASSFRRYFSVPPPESPLLSSTQIWPQYRQKYAFSIHSCLIPLYGLMSPLRSSQQSRSIVSRILMVGLLRIPQSFDGSAG